MSLLKYYRGEKKNPYLKGNPAPLDTDWDLLKSNPKAFWWDFETTYGHAFNGDIATTVECFAMKHSDYAPISEQSIIDSWKNNGV